MLTKQQTTVPATAAPPVFAAVSQLSSRNEWGHACDKLFDAKIAIIDDEEMNIEVVQGHLEEAGYRHFRRTTDSTMALELLIRETPDVVLLDVMMPQISGLDILQTMKEIPQLRHIPVVVLTACTGPETKLEALHLGAADFLAKPVDGSELLLRLKNVLNAKYYQDHLSEYSQQLEKIVKERTKEVVESRQRILRCLARAAEFRDDDTGQHVIRVGRYAALIAVHLGFGQRDVELIEQAAQLHDIGKIGVPDAVLLKDGKLERDEFAVIKQHCNFGSSIIDPLSQSEAVAYQKHANLGAALLLDETRNGQYPILELAAVIAETHHEKWDGSGYPKGLAGENIPIEGRITAVADVFDALGSERPYKKAFSNEKCLQILEEGRGQHFDPQVLDAFFAAKDQILEVKRAFADKRQG